MNVIIYTRTSNSQNISYQINNLSKLCQKNKWNVVNIITDIGISGRVNNRPGLNILKNSILSNEIDMIVVTEISRISRDKDFLLKFINKMNERNIDIWIESINNKAKSLTESQIDFATLEVIQIRSRLESGYYNFIEKGGKVGRKVGWSKKDEDILNENKDVIKYHQLGLSVRSIMRLTNRSTGTVQKVKKILKKQKQSFK